MTTPDEPTGTPGNDPYAAPAPGPDATPTPYGQSVPEQGSGQTAYGQPSYGQAPYGQQAYGQQPYGQGPPPTAGTNGFAIASLVCAFFCSPLGLIFGFVALNQIKQRNQGGRGLAIAGLVLSGVFLLIGILLFATDSNGTSAGALRIG